MKFLNQQVNTQHIDSLLGSQYNFSKNLKCTKLGSNDRDVRGCVSTDYWVLLDAAVENINRAVLTRNDSPGER
jgi:hypothetical protein